MIFYDSKLRKQLRISLLWFSWRVAYPLAWWWLSWRGSRTSWCLRTSQPSTLRTLLARPRPRRIGIASQSWNLGRFLWPIFGTATFWWAIPWTFGTCGFLSTRRYPGGICAASWRHQSPARICARPWSRVAFSGLCRRWIYEQFVWYEPLFLNSNEDFFSTILWKTRKTGKVRFEHWKYVYHYSELISK